MEKVTILKIIFIAFIIFSAGWYIGFKQNIDPWMRSFNTAFDKYCTFKNYDYHTVYKGDYFKEVNYTMNSDSNFSIPLWLT